MVRTQACSPLHHGSMVPPGGVEPTLSTLKGSCPSDRRRRRWSSQRDSNPRHESEGLVSWPLEDGKMVSVPRIELSYTCSRNRWAATAPDAGTSTELFEDQESSHRGIQHDEPCAAQEVVAPRQRRVSHDVGSCNGYSRQQRSVSCTPACYPVDRGTCGASDQMSSGARTKT